MAEKPAQPEILGGYPEAVEIGDLYEQASVELTALWLEAVQSGQLADDAYREDLARRLYDILLTLHQQALTIGNAAVIAGMSSGIRSAEAKLVTNRAIGQPIRLGPQAATALKAVQDTLAGRLTDLNVTIGRRFNDALRVEGLKATQTKITNLGTTGPAATELRKSLERRGLTIAGERGKRVVRLVPVKGADGKVRNWEAGAYARMVVRTNAAQAHTEGVVTRCKDYGVDLVQIDRHGAYDDLCLPHEGAIYSISGKHPKYPPLLPDNAPPYHPCCWHHATPYVP